MSGLLITVYKSLLFFLNYDRKFYLKAFSSFSIPKCWLQCILRAVVWSDTLEFNLKHILCHLETTPWNAVFEQSRMRYSQSRDYPFDLPRTPQYVEVKNRCVVMSWSCYVTRDWVKIGQRDILRFTSHLRGIINIVIKPDERDIFELRLTTSAGLGAFDGLLVDS